MLGAKVVALSLLLQGGEAGMPGFDPISMWRSMG